jgi:hypothetical protein
MRETKTAMAKRKIPFNFTPEPHHLEVLRCPSRYIVIVWHRKARKTTLAVNELVRWCYYRPDTYWYVGPEREQAKKTIWDAPDMLPRYIPPEVWAKRNNSDLMVKFPNGSILYVLGSKDPDRLRGPNPYGVMLDEYGDQNPDIWNGVIQPIMTASAAKGSWCWFLGTPKGENDFAQKYRYAAASGDPNWSAFMLKASQSGLIDNASLDDMKRTTTQAFYDQEMECAFIGSATQVFRNVRSCLWNAPLTPDPAHSYQLGVDLGKYQDWTVITPFDLNTFRAGQQDRFNQVDWGLQKARIEAAYYKHSGASIPRTFIDKTGLGDPIVDDLLHQGLNRVEGYTFTEQTRNNLLEHLSIMLENCKIKIPDDDGLISELESFRFEMTASRKIRMAVPEGMHDDRVMSLALAVWDCKDKQPLSYPQSSQNFTGFPMEKFDPYAVI